MRLPDQAYSGPREDNRPLNGLFLNHVYIFSMGDKNTAQIFAENLSQLRKKKGLSQYDLAHITGISRSMLSHYEREGMVPPGDRLDALSAALDISVNRLFESSVTMTNPADLSNIDPRSVKKLRDILSLPPEDRNDLYRILNKMLRKNQLEKQGSEPQGMSSSTTGSTD
jgi:transcriptional regulator with XRE-family HTH domain